MRNVSVTAHCYTDIDPSLVLCLEETESERERNPRSDAHTPRGDRRATKDGKKDGTRSDCLSPLVSSDIFNRGTSTLCYCRLSSHTHTHTYPYTWMNINFHFHYGLTMDNNELIDGKSEK